MKPNRIIAGFASLVFLAGCLPASATPGTEGNKPEVISSANPVQSTTMTAPAIPVTPEVAATLPVELDTKDLVTPPAEAESIVVKAKEALANKLAIPAGDVILVSIDKVMWRDASFGCAQEGMVYALVVTPGYSVTLEAGGKTYVYHTDEGSMVIQCKTVVPGEFNPTIEIPPPRN